MSDSSDLVGTALRLALKEAGRLRHQNQQLQAQWDEPIAIVGMSCRFPGGVVSPEGLWDLVASGTDAISSFPENRGWDLEALYDPDPDRAGTVYTREGGFLYDAAEFDPGFFGIGPREALAMDPQQRLLLEGAWEALEDAGLDPASLRGSPTGVFTGASCSGYAMNYKEDLEGYRLTGTTGSVVSGRVSYVFGLEGPAMTVDTACSSSLVALHLACGALRQGECSLALAGGATVMSSPGPLVEFSAQRVSSPDGRCKSYADTADGAGWSEGVGVLVLERLSEARRNAHRVLAVVRGSAVNQDGASNGLTAPNGPSQQRVIRQALANANLLPRDVDVVEGHGTGTKLGDPIEAQALLATYGQERRDGRPLYLGSIKSNIGHTSAAAGVAGVIKMVKALEHGLLPRTLHLDEPSSNVDWSAGIVSLLTEEVAWESNGEPRRAAVSSFGISGTNAHVVLEESPAAETAPAATEAPTTLSESDADVENSVLVGDGGVGDANAVFECDLVPLLLSARDEPALRAQAERLREYLGRSPELSLRNVGFSLVGRSVFEHRAVVVGGEREGSPAGLEALSRSEAVAGVVEGRVPVVGGADGRVVFLFPGQGSQWKDMAVELLGCSPVFAGYIRRCADALAPYVDFSLEDVLRGAVGAPGLDRVDVVQPALFAVMVSLAALWRSCGVQPDVVVGHSQGEIAAAHVAGGLSLEDAAKVVALRSRALASLAGLGGMVSVSIASADLGGLIERWGERLSLAAINGPSSVVVSGEPRALQELLQACEAEELRARVIPVDYASHSAQVESIRGELLEACSSLTLCSSETLFYSTVTGSLLDTAELDAEYWYRNLHETVQFERVTRTLLAEGCRTFIEISPHPVLAIGVQETVEEALGDPDDALVVGSLRRDQGGPERFLESLAELWVRGVDVGWGELFRGVAVKRVGLPTYAFQRERYWLNASTGTGDMASAGQASADHPLLGAALALADDRGWLFTGRISLETHPWLADHIVMGNVLLPGTAFVELALHVGGQVECPVVVELTLEAPLILGERGGIALQVSVGEADESGARPVGIYSRAGDGVGEGLVSGGEWTRHAAGVLAPGDLAVVQRAGLERYPEVFAGGVWPPEGAQAVSVDELYDRLAALGLELGPVFQGLRSMWVRGEEVFAEASLPEDQLGEASSFGVHPALLDAALQTMGAVSLGEGSGEMRLPFSFGGVELHAAGARSLRVALSLVGSESVSLVIADETGGPVASVGSMVVRSVSAEQLGAAAGAVGAGGGDGLFGVGWNPVVVSSGSAAEDVTLLAGEGSALGKGLAGAGCVVGAYEDLGALGEFLGGDGVAPVVVLADCALGGWGADEEGSANGASMDGTAGRGGVSGVDEGGGLSGVHLGAHRVLRLLQGWLADERFANARLVLVTQGAVAVDGAGSLSGLSQSSLWGLVRSAQAENPERFVLVDIDDEDASYALLPSALTSDEPQLAIHAGKVFAPRLERVASAALDGPAQEDTGALDSGGAVLITGGTGTLGGLLARHLVTRHGVSHLVLASRQGEDAEGADTLRAELESLGASVRIAACDVSDREDLAELLDSITREGPLTGVVHAAGVLDDGVIESLAAERIDRTLGPKADAAWYLHELTEHLDLSMFVLFSSAAGLLGSPGQGGYAAANAFLDALACYRSAHGLPGVSIAWGLWQEASGMTVGLSDADRSRLMRSGMRALSTEQGLELFDAALTGGEAQVLAAPWDLGVLRAQGRAGVLPAILSGMVRVSRRRAGEQGGSLARRLAAVPEGEREGVVVEIVRAQVAGVLGHASPDAVDPQRAFKDLGFDSLAAVGLRNRLNHVTGLRLPATLVFDYPTSVAVASYLLSKVLGTGVAGGDTLVSVVALDEPIAVVGMSCHYPGGVSSPEEFWGLIASGGDAITSFPADRGWDLEALYDPDPDNPGTIYALKGGFLSKATEFDADFFGLSPREALAMDPQQRVLLEACWEAIENAGIDPSALRGSQTGVFAGVSSAEFGSGLWAAPDGLENLAGYWLTGSTGSVVSGRVAYTFGLEGPAVSVDTACSSSLVTLHLACQALRCGDCTLALTGGVAVMSAPALHAQFSAQRALAHDGRCRSFAAAADGTSFSEGVGVLLLERLSDAQRHGHRVLGLVRGSAVNQDGASNGLTAPNGPSQQRVIRQALANAGVSAGEVDVVEAHGTGTTLGDPIEAQALLATYGQDRARPLWLGSVKSNIGHAATAAGVAGVIKMVKAFEHGVLPRTLHVDEPSREVDWSEGSVSLLTEEVQWERGGAPRRAGVSSFGVSGTNVHVILEEAPVMEAAISPPELDGEGDGGGVGVEDVEDACGSLVGFVDGVVPWVLSGRGGEALRGQAGRLREYLVGGSAVGPQPVDVGFSLAGRCAFGDRAVVVGEGREELVGRLGGVVGGESRRGVAVGSGPASAAAGAAGVVFVFPGQGSQWVGMAVELLDGSPVFREHLGKCERALSEFVGWSVEEVLRGGDGVPGLERVDVVQPVLWALMVSLAGLWEWCGVRPVAVVGHSQGEIAAAVVAGGLSLQDGARVVALRSQALVEISGLGGMLSIARGAEETAGRLESFGERVSLAAVNGPGSVVVSGELSALERLLADCERDGVRARLIPVDYAAHSRQVESIRERLLEGCAGVAPRAGRVPFYSAVSGGRLDCSELDGHYWYRNLRETVRFDRATRALLEANERGFVEVSPHPVLTVGVQEMIDTLDDPGGGLVAGSLRRGEGGTERFLTSLGEVWVSGGNVDWRKVLAGRGGQHVELPTYAFQRQRYWLSSAGGGGDPLSFGQAALRHPLLGAAVALADGGGWLFTGRLSLDTHSWLADHAVLGSVLLPGTALLELALHAGGELEVPVVSELVLRAPVVIPEQGALRLQVSVGEPGEHGARPISIHTSPESSDADSGFEGEWTLHATGTLIPQKAETSAVSAGRLGGGVWPPVDAEPLDLDGFYDRVADLGLEYGPVFQGLTAAWRDGKDLYAEVALSEDHEQRASSFAIHPALLDAALHPGALLAHRAAGTDGQGPLLPFSWEGVAISTHGASRLRVHLSLNVDATAVSLTATDDTGHLVITADSLTTRAIPADQLGRIQGSNSIVRDSLFQVEWMPAPTALDIGPAVGVSTAGAVEPLVVLGGRDSVLAGVLGNAGGELTVHPDLGSLGEATESGAPIPSVVFLDVHSSDFYAAGNVRKRLRGVLEWVLETVQAWIADERFDGSRLVVVTGASIATASAGGAAETLGTGEVDASDGSGLLDWPVWGLVRSAQAEHPGRFVLLGVDGIAVPTALLGRAIAIGEPEVVVHGKEVFVRRFARVSGSGEAIGAQDVEFGEGSVLVTGGTGGLGALIGRHLVSACGVRSLVLASRRGPEAPGASELATELEALGADVKVVACDVSDRGEVDRLLGLVPAEHPLRGLVHAAGVLDDGLIDSLTAERVDHVLAPKVDAAWHLHEATKEMGLVMFVLFSSVAGTLGSPGQGNYAAANAFLDALAACRQAQGLPATSLVWGVWQEVTELTESLGAAGVARLRHQGILPLASEDVLTLFDASRALAQASIVAVHLDLPTLRAQARAGVLPTHMRALVRTPVRRAPGAALLTARLSEAPERERAHVVLEAVCGEVAVVLGYEPGRPVDVDQPFKDLGFDSLGAIELRNRLSVVTGARLATTLVFDHPTPRRLADHLLLVVSVVAPNSHSAGIDKLEQLLSATVTGADRAQRAELKSRLQAFAAQLDDPSSDTDTASDNAKDLKAATDEELFALIDGLETSGSDHP